MHSRFIYLLALVSLLFLSSSATGQILNSLTFIDTDKTAVSGKSVSGKHALMLIYFRSDCDHCMHTAQLLKEKKYHIPIWMVSAESIEVLRTFEDMQGFYDREGLTVLQDNTSSMHRWFDFSHLPFIVLFDKKGKQVKTLEALPEPAFVKTLIP